MTLYRTLLAIAVSTTLLTACNKTEAPKAEEKTAETTTDVKPADTASTSGAEATATQTTDGMPADVKNLIIDSPYMDFQVSASRAVTINTLKAENPNLTDIQKACLASLEGNPNYLSVLEPHFKGILNEAEIKEADEFFATDAGRSFAQIMLTQMGAENLPPMVEPTADEQKEMAAAMLKPYFLKVKANTDAMSEQEALDFMNQIVDKEKVRCNIS